MVILKHNKYGTAEGKMNEMKDIYLMNKETGEIEASEKVFKEFYKTHKIFDSVFDEWIETNLEVENSEITNPLQQILNCIIAE